MLRFPSSSQHFFALTLCFHLSLFFWLVFFMSSGTVVWIGYYKSRAFRAPHVVRSGFVGIGYHGLFKSNFHLGFLGTWHPFHYSLVKIQTTLIFFSSLLYYLCSWFPSILHFKWCPLSLKVVLLYWSFTPSWIQAISVLGL